DDLPRLFSGCKKLTFDERREVTRHLKPILGEIVPTQAVKAGLLFLPVYASQILDPRERGQCRHVLEQGLITAAAIGPGAVVCLGGLTGSLSAYGRKIAGQADQLGLQLTTGHSVTAISILDTYFRAVQDLGLAP